MNGNKNNNKETMHNFTKETMEKRLASRRRTKIQELVRPIDEKFLVRGKIYGVDY